MSSYNGEFIVDLDAADWTIDTAFDCGMATSKSETAPSLDLAVDGYQISLSRQLLAADDDEWQVFQNGRWMDSVLFNSSSTNAEVRMSLVEVDDYPEDIVVLKVKRLL